MIQHFLIPSILPIRPIPIKTKGTSGPTGDPPEGIDA